MRRGVRIPPRKFPLGDLVPHGGILGIARKNASRASRGCVDRYNADMQLTVNGQPFEVPDGSTVRALLERMELGQSPCAVEVNKRLVTKRLHAEHALAEGDTVEVVTLVGGG